MVITDHGQVVEPVDKTVDGQLDGHFGGADSGLYLVAESIDCGGKGAVISAIKDWLVSKGKTVVDLRLLWPSGDKDKVPPGHDNPLAALYRTDNVIPEYAKLKGYYKEITGNKIDAIVTCEPTWSNVGLAIRRKIIHELEGMGYNAKDTAQAYADDRQELISRLILPAIRDSVDVFCERNFCSSIVYQSSMDDSADVESIMSLEGNRFAAGNAPRLYIICDVSAETAMERKASRVKQDQCRFEVLPFQKKVAGKYASVWLKEMLNSHGSMVVYVNTEKPTRPEDTAAAALSIIRKFRSGTLKDGQKFNYGMKAGEDR